MRHKRILGLKRNESALHRLKLLHEQLQEEQLNLIKKDDGYIGIIKQTRGGESLILIV